MSIEVKKVTKLYGRQKALNNISFSIESGQIVGFLGPNGAGKSTMMKIITGFIPPTDGNVYVNGTDVMDNQLDVRKQIGYLPENNPLYLDMYVIEYLEFVARIYKIGRNKQKRISEMIDMTGLDVEKGKKIGQLSKGYRQRVGLAQALIHDPNVLILDEPTSGLDPNQIIEIRNLISSIGKQKTVMLSTHIMQEVEAICDKIIIINKGEIVAEDLTIAIQNTGNGNTHTILVEFNAGIDEQKLLQIENVDEVKKLEGYKWLLQSKTDADIREKVFKFAVDNDCMLMSMQKKEKSLEEVFRELTNQ